ncbi:hypothetical protein G6F65_022920 [Rhizopus arrhizus]|nr:hypothetical protein G6F65_022920 [Rhizopus arrhizus]
MRDIGVARRGQNGLRSAGPVFAQILDLPLAQQLQTLHEGRPRGLDRPAAKQESAPGWLHDYNSFFRYKTLSRIQCLASPRAPMIF